MPIDLERVSKALWAMNNLGIPKAKVKPVLKSLLKLYDKKWELIEEENYRALADAIFEREEAEAAECKKKADNTEIPKPPVQQEKVLDEEVENEEPERPLKRLRLKYQDGQASSSAYNSSAGTSLQRPKQEKEDELNRTAAGSPNIPLQAYNGNKGKQLVLTAEPGGDMSRKQKMPGSLALIKPKDEPYTDDMPQFEVPIAVIHPEPSNKEDTSSSKSSRGHLETSGALAIELRGGRDADDGIPASSNGMVELQSRCYSNVDIASSSLGEVKLSIRYNSALPRSEFQVPSLESVLKMVEDKCLRSYKFLDPNFSVMKLMKDLCDCVEALGTQQPSLELQETSNVSAENDSGLRNMFDNSSNGFMNFEFDAGDAQMEISQFCHRIGEESTQAGQTASLGNSCSVLEADQNGLEQTNPQSTLVPYGSISGEIGSVDSLNEFLNFDLCDGDAQPDISQLVPLIAEDSTPVDHTASMGNVGIARETNDSCLEQIGSQALVTDITKGQENDSISLVNEVNSKLAPVFQYIAHNVVFQSANVSFSLARIGDDNSCRTCSGDCLSSSAPCACARESGGEFAYTKEGLVKEEFLKECVSMNRDPKKHNHFFCKECPLERSKAEDGMIEPCKGHLITKFIKECWWKCGCNKQCGNRVVQRGISHKLQVFMSPEGKGWGLRTLEDLPRGAFVCEYVGEVLTNAELFHRIWRSPEEHSYPVLLDAGWGSEGVLKDEEALCLDATFYGNVARFINHRCFDANLVEIPVEVETPDHRYYHLAFFTTRNVKAMEELTWDYGIDFDDLEHPVKAFSCHCGSNFCRNMKRPTRSRTRMQA